MKRQILVKIDFDKDQDQVMIGVAKGDEFDGECNPIKDIECLLNAVYHLIKLSEQCGINKKNILIFACKIYLDELNRGLSANDVNQIVLKYLETSKKQID